MVAPPACLSQLLATRSHRHSGCMALSSSCPTRRPTKAVSTAQSLRHASSAPATPISAAAPPRLPAFSPVKVVTLSQDPAVLAGGAASAAPRRSDLRHSAAAPVDSPRQQRRTQPAIPAEASGSSSDGGSRRAGNAPQRRTDSFGSFMSVLEGGSDFSDLYNALAGADDPRRSVTSRGSTSPKAARAVSGRGTRATAQEDSSSGRAESVSAGRRQLPKRTVPVRSRAASQAASARPSAEGDDIRLGARTPTSLALDAIAAFLPIL